MTPEIRIYILGVILLANYILYGIIGRYWLGFIGWTIAMVFFYQYSVDRKEISALRKEIVNNVEIRKIPKTRCNK
jgi:hypothetical protein